MAKFGWKTFIGGFLLGTVGLDLLKAEEADKVYTALAAATLVSRDWVLERYEAVSARARDVMADAKVKADAYLEKKKGADCADEVTFRGVDE